MNDLSKILFNPAFCGCILYKMIERYIDETKHGCNLSVLYLVLPFILPESYRDTVVEYSLQQWCENNTLLMKEYPRIASKCIELTNDAILFLLIHNTIEINGNVVHISNKIIDKDIKQLCLNEVDECIKKARRIGLWFSKISSPKDIYYFLGVKP